MVKLRQVRTVVTARRERALDVAQLAIAVQHVIDRRRRHGGRFLRDMRENPPRRKVDRARVGLKLPANRCEQARFAGAVRADDAHFVPVMHGERRAVEQPLRAAREDEVRDAQHQGRSTKS